MGTVSVINTEVRKIAWASKSHDAPISDVTFTPSMRHILSSSLDGLKVNEIASDQGSVTLVDGRSEFGLCQGAIPSSVVNSLVKTRLCAVRLVARRVELDSVDCHLQLRTLNSITMKLGSRLSTFHHFQAS